MDRHLRVDEVLSRIEELNRYRKSGLKTAESLSPELYLYGK